MVLEVIYYYRTHTADTNRYVYIMKTRHFLKIRSGNFFIVFIQIAFTFYSAHIVTTTPYSLHISKISFLKRLNNSKIGLKIPPIKRIYEQK